MRIETEILETPCGCGHDEVEVIYEPGTHIIVRALCKNCGKKR